MILDPGSDRVQAVFLRGHCRLMALGMNNSRLTRTRVLQLAGAITGVTYKRGQHGIAADDLTTWIEEHRAL